MAAEHVDLLRRFRPQLVYDSLEAYFADHPGQMVVNPGNELRRGDEVLARVDDGTLTLDVLKPDGGALANDVLSIKGRDYAKQYGALRLAHPEFNNMMVARARTDDHGVVWLQYWLWYFYNDYRLTADVGLHEGDWEMVQLRLGDDGTPDYAIYNQHKRAQRRPWDRVEKDPDNPDTAIVYVARGSHASYFEPGVHPTEVWADVCDGGRKGPPARLLVIDDGTPWARWPGRWGDTRPRNATESDSPTGPGRKKEWDNPAHAFDHAYEEERPAKHPLAGPDFGVGRHDGRLLITYNLIRLTGTPKTVVVNVNSTQEPGVPPKTFAFDVPTGAKRGSIATDVPVDSAKTYDIRLSMDIRTPAGETLPSVTVRRTLDPGDHAPKRPFTTTLGTLFVPVTEWVKRLLRRRP
ncbi:MAG TPA: hypothetical protein VFG42_18420 [Baekduia sp.]|uniref:hypothetical protein n=1 Tax=Baekduia sp. TaxID=2600305 RepID=UPI002D765E1A|nr:hypothetical protein [Baekduia sp.]HET6508775.1 hypothetical protein [Baekduia sp.]